MFVCSQLQHNYSAVFLLLVTAASDLLVHKILLNSVLLSPIVSGGVRPNPPYKHPLFAAVCGSVGVRTPPRGSDMVRSTINQSVFNKNTRRVLSYDVIRQQKTGVIPGGLTSLRIWRITSSPSQTLRRRLVRSTTTDAAVCSTLAAVRRGFVFHTSRLVRLTTL